MLDLEASLQELFGSRSSSDGAILIKIAMTGGEWVWRLEMNGSTVLQSGEFHTREDAQFHCVSVMRRLGKDVQFSKEQTAPEAVEPK